MTATERRRLVEDNLDLLDIFAGRMAKGQRLLPEEEEDLRQDGYFGLAAAAERFDQDLGVKFRTYAARRIFGAMLDARRDGDLISKQARTRIGKLNTAIDAFRARRGR